MNSWSFGRVFGFPVMVEWTALAMVAFLVLVPAQAGPVGLASGVVQGGVVFGSILVHELGHAILARRAGLGPITITLHGFGGLARMTHSPRPWPGIWITLAGPACSLALGLVGLGLVILLGDFLAPFTRLLASMNLFWGAFNLLPMFPLDGGMVLFHGLALRLPAGVAMVWAARVGGVVAVAVGIAGFLAGQVFISIVAMMALLQSVPIALARR